jgi:hypothetical protein
LLALVAAAVVQAPTPQDRDPDLARRLYLSALDLQAEFEYDSARVLMRQALAADPTDLAAHDQFIWLTREFLPDGVAEIRRAYDSMPDSPQVNACAPGSPSRMTTRHPRLLPCSRCRSGIRRKRAWSSLSRGSSDC